MSDARPPLGRIFESFAVAATVTPRGGTAISTTVVELGPQPVTTGDGILVNESRPVFSMQRASVASLPRESSIQIGAKTWIVDGNIPAPADELRVFVVAA